MIRLLGFLIALPLALQAAPAPPLPRSVAVLYNSSSPDSKALAELYAQARQIPADNLIGLPLPDAEEISRKDFNAKLLEPLVAEYEQRQWWKRQKDSQGNIVPVDSQIDVLVCMRGVPSRIAPDPSLPIPQPGEKAYLETNQAAVDSELALLGVEGLPLKGGLKNPYFQHHLEIGQANLPMTLVGRIDAPTPAICERMIRDAVETEKSGLWGMTVIDIAKKFPEAIQGDPALENIARNSREAGFPVMVDRFPETLPPNFPLKDTAVYFGWYDWHVSGPFLNPAFKFKKGAVAVHLHSFSAAQLRNPSQNWSAPLLAKGAAATLGNVYEPFLQMTHHFDIFHERLLEGYTLVEAAYMSLPVLSWQNVVLGDPLYRPFLRLDGSGEVLKEDKPYRALRVAQMRWKGDAKEMDAMLREGADRLKSGPMMEAIALMRAAGPDAAGATADFQKAKLYYADKPDRLRMDLHIAAQDRAAGRNAAAAKILRGAGTLYLDIPEATAAAAWLNLLEPPPAKPQQK